jgi:phosphatidylserine/phosphatidylglycerophosphate/cardiolipin synthase-like enzyme
LPAIVAQLRRLCLDGQPANLNISSCALSQIRISTVNSRYASFTAEPRSLTFPGLASERFIAETLKGRWSRSWELGRLHGALEVLAGPFGPSAGSTFTCPPRRVLAAWGVSSAGCPATRSIRAAVHTAGDQPLARAASSGGGLSLIVEPDQGLGQIDRDVAAAKHSVDMTMYELDDTTIEAELVADRRRGVTVRVLLNGGYYGGGFSENDDATSYLRANGVTVRTSSASFALTHQKTITIDDRTSLVMTLNLTSRYYSTSRDFAILDTQPADVAAIEQVFNADWSHTPITPSDGSGDLVWSPGAESEQIALIDSAHSTLDVENEEMDDSYITSALCDVARRRVKVSVVMTYDDSWREAFDELTGCGVQVRTYSEDAPLYIHAKEILVDGREAFVGSQNFSRTSLQDNRELGIVTSDPAIVGELGRTFASDFRGASPFSS